MPPPRLSARRHSHDRGYIRHGAAGREFRSGGWLRHHELEFHQHRQPARLGDEIPFGISAADQRHHLYLIGKTGSGKTTLLRNLIVQHIAAGAAQIVFCKSSGGQAEGEMDESMLR